MTYLPSQYCLLRDIFELPLNQYRTTSECCFSQPASRTETFYN
uniref:Uncharacterized protein n=1 Tax=Anguilla anguilla TaxID=7936 RepID=A0A0E9SBM9_ANGAN